MATLGGRALASDADEAYPYPYPGAKPHLRIDADRWEDGEWLADLVRVTAAELSALSNSRPGAPADSGIASARRIPRHLPRSSAGGGGGKPHPRPPAMRVRPHASSARLKRLEIGDYCTCHRNFRVRRAAHPHLTAARLR